MLTYFPTPYPNEWWYSVLARFYVHTGCESYSACFRNFGYSSYQNFGQLFPSSNIEKIIQNLPNGFYSSSQVLLNHTLLPYYMRFRQEKEKKETLTKLSRGESVVYSNIVVETPDGKEGCKYCPKCYQEDISQYGEPYWHREHQIPLMQACPYHGCKLEIYEISHQRLKEVLLPLTGIECARDSEEASELECALAKILLSYVELPYEIGPTEGYNNLSLKLQIDGFDYLVGSGLDFRKICESCKCVFPESIINQYFKNPSSSIFNRMAQWKLSGPERYALLQFFAGISTEELFGKRMFEEVSVVKIEKFLEMAKSGKLYRRKDVESELGVCAATLYKMAQQFKVRYFWVTSAKGAYSKRTNKVHLNLTEGEYEYILKASEASGNLPVAVFVRNAVLMEAERVLNRKPETDSLP